MKDVLNEAMDVEGLKHVLRGNRCRIDPGAGGRYSGAIAVFARDI